MPMLAMTRPSPHFQLVYPSSSTAGKNGLSDCNAAGYNGKRAVAILWGDLSVTLGAPDASTSAWRRGTFGSGVPVYARVSTAYGASGAGGAGGTNAAGAAGSQGGPSLNSTDGPTTIELLVTTKGGGGGGGGGGGDSV